MCLKISQPCTAMGIGEKDPWWSSRSFSNSVWALPEKSNINIMASSKQSLQWSNCISIRSIPKAKNRVGGLRTYAPLHCFTRLWSIIEIERSGGSLFWVISSPMLSVAMMIYTGLGHELHWWDCVLLASIKLYKSLLMSLLHNSLQNNIASIFLCATTSYKRRNTAIQWTGRGQTLQVMKT